MRVPKLKTFIGFKLRVGALFFAYAYIVVTLGLLAYLAYTTYIDISHDYYHYFTYIRDTAVLAQFITTVLLLIGIYKKNLSFIASWTICSFILGVMVLMDIFDYVYYLSIFQDWPSFIELTIWMAELAFRCYGLLVVHNHYKEVSKNSGKDLEPQSDAIQLV